MRVCALPAIIATVLLALTGCATLNPRKHSRPRQQEIGYCGCSLFDVPGLLRHQVLETQYWLVVLHPHDQYYLGRSVIILKRHVPTLAEVSDAEWLDYKQLVGDFAEAASEALGADHFNWSFNMNHAFRDDPPQPHVHGHVRPRYRNPVTFADLTFEDGGFGNHYDLEQRQVAPAVHDTIRDKLVHAHRKNSNGN